MRGAVARRLAKWRGLRRGYARGGGTGSAVGVALGAGGAPAADARRASRVQRHTATHVGSSPPSVAEEPERGREAEDAAEEPPSETAGGGAAGLAKISRSTEAARAASAASASDASAAELRAASWSAVADTRRLQREASRG